MDNGTPKSYTLGVVKSMGYTPVAISLMEGEEVFVFKTQEEATLVEEDFSPEGIWLGEKEFSEIPKKELKKVYDLVEKKSPVGLKTKFGEVVAVSEHGAVIGLSEPLVSSISGNVYCFTGFRNEVLESNVIAMGATVEPRVTNRTTHLIAKDTSKRTAKYKEAEARGCGILSLDAFDKQLQVEAVKVILGGL